MKYIVTSNGLEAMEINPYEKEGKDWHDYGHFEKNVNTYPLTEKQEPGSIIECELVWQYKHADEWLINQQQPYKMDSIPDLYKRQALQPIPQPEKVKEETVEELAEIASNKYFDGWSSEEIGSKADHYEAGFIAGWKANNEHQHKATIDKVVEVIGETKAFFDIKVKMLKNALHPYDQGRYSGFESGKEALTDLIKQIKEIKL